MTRKYSEIRKDENECLLSISRQLDELRGLVLEAGESLKFNDELTNKTYEKILKVQRNLDELSIQMSVNWKDEVIKMFKDLKNVWLMAFGFGVKNTADGPDDRLKLHDDPFYYFNLNKQCQTR